MRPRNQRPAPGTIPGRGPAPLACRLRGAPLVFIAGALCLASARAGETPADPDLSTEGLRRAGPLHIRPFVALKDVGYDDNIRFEAQQRQGDFTATAGPGLGALLLTGDRGGIYLSQEYDYVAFRDNPDLNHWNSSARARGIFLLKRAALSLEDRFTSERERPNNEIDQRLRREQNAVTASARTLGRGRLAVRTFVRQERIDYSSDEPGFEDVGLKLNRQENTLSLAGELRVLPKTTFVVEGVLERVAFDDRSQGRDTRTTSILPGFRFDPSASVQGGFKLGVMSLEAVDRSQSDFRGTVGEGSLSTRLGGSARLKSTFARSLVFSIQDNNLYYVSTDWSAAYEQYFSRRLSAEMLYGRGLNHYPEEMIRIPFQGIRNDTLTNYQMSIRYRVNDQLSFSARAHRMERDSTDDFFDRERNLYAIGSEYEF